LSAIILTVMIVKHIFALVYYILTVLSGIVGKNHENYLLLVNTGARHAIGNKYNEPP